MSQTAYPVLKAYNPELIQDVEFTTLTDVATAGSTSAITVEAITGFAVGDYVLIGEIGSETAEIIRLHASTAPSGNTITLESAVVETHQKGERVYLIDRNQVEFSRATTLTGSKSTLTTVAINPQNLYTTYEDTSNTTGFGFYRWKNSGDTTYSNYSESFPYAGYDINSLKEIFDSVLIDMGLVDQHGNPEFKGKFSRRTFFKAAQDIQDDINSERSRWSYLENFDVTVDELTIGQDSYTSPTGVNRTTGQAGILLLRLGGKDPMTYLDKEEFVRRRRDGVVQTTLNGAVTTASSTWTLTDTSDFPDSGSIKVVNDGEDGFDTVDFTANDRANNQLTVDTDTIAEAHADGAIVWSGVDVGQPLYWTQYEGSIYVDPVPSADWNDRNLIADLYEEPTLVDDLADTTQFPANVLKKGIFAKMLPLKYTGDKSRPEIQAARDEYNEALIKLRRKEDTGQRFKVQPNRVPRRRTGN